MAVTTDVAEFRSLLPSKARLLGLDLGTKTIGLAIATMPIGIASQLRTIRRTRFRNDARELMAIVVSERVDALIVGLPLNMDGSAGPRAQSTRAFLRSLQAFSPPPALLFDERLSSAAAEDAMREAGVRASRRAATIDAHAARIILQDAIDHLSAIDHADRSHA